MLDIRNSDCMDLMKEYPDKHFELAIVDPPYGLQAMGNLSRMNGAGKLANRAINMLSCDFDMLLPTPEYFQELIRVSKTKLYGEVTIFHYHQLGVLSVGIKSNLT